MHATALMFRMVVAGLMRALFGKSLRQSLEKSESSSTAGPRELYKGS